MSYEVSSAAARKEFRQTDRTDKEDFDGKRRRAKQGLNTMGYMATPRKWTRSSIECYERGCNCMGCPTQLLLTSQKCRMKYSVFELVKIFGAPNANDKIENIQSTKNEIIEEKIMFDEDLKLKYSDYLTPLVEAVKKGFESYDDLARETGMSKHQVSVYWGNLYNQWSKDGLLIKETGKTQKQQVIEFIRNRLIDVQNGNISDVAEPEKPKLKGKIVIKSRAAGIASTSTLKEKEKYAVTAEVLPITIQPTQTEKTDETNKEDKDFMINQPLTKMEQTVLDLLLQGLNYKQIAEKIPISYTTVKAHINNIFQKKDCHSLQELLVAEFDKNKPVVADTNKVNRLSEELNQTKLLLEGKNNQYQAALDGTIRLQRENEELKKRIKELENRPMSVSETVYIQKYDEFMLIDDVRDVLNSEDENRIKIISIKNYFRVYDRFTDKKENKKCI